MKTIILCGGQGIRMREDTEFRPKPLMAVGEKPILLHIMKIYSHYGYNKFILPLGYKGEMIKDYFSSQVKSKTIDKFLINFIDTGLESTIGERILRVKKFITDNEFMVTYGDGVADVDIKDLVRFHRQQGTLGTITGVHPYSKYGLVKIDSKSKLVTAIDQKPLLKDYISGGFMVFNKQALNYFNSQETDDMALKKMAQAGQLSMYEHKGFWKAMDTHREMEELNQLLNQDRPWAIWEKNKTKK